MSHNDTTSLYQSSQSDIDEIENMINNDGSVLPARPSIPVTSSPFVQSNLPTLPQDRRTYNLLPKPKSKCNGSPTLILSVPPYAELNRFIL
ncbi:hypothetical protein F2Q69_00057710 [Brassica cretica]|uniref:Uncharacterized protein n=1 Tax=Brassica cretica TaxID=69181 RepID=A0A8S9MX40_BRACR|nr:hypothetical protein F2Q69_00057710 [Brassica cretica]